MAVFLRRLTFLIFILALGSLINVGLYALSDQSAACVRGEFASTGDPIPAEWPLEDRFGLSQNYPDTMPARDILPWDQIDFETEPEQYLMAVRDYVYDGNIDPANPNARWTLDNWYHAPYLHVGGNGREFIHGLTRELAAAPGRIWTNPPQDQEFDNWAIGFYNELGGYIIGQIWCNPDRPTLLIPGGSFPDGTVAAKLLFTAAPDGQVPFVESSIEWTANICPRGTSNGCTKSNRTPQTVRLLQLDIAVRETDNQHTGWVFGTFIYDPSAPGNNAWEKMVPVGLIWGNDPQVTPSNGLPIEQTWLSSDAAPLMQHYGWAGRLNGPVDNPESSCLSCHSTASYPNYRPSVPEGNDVARLKWFRNIPAGEPFECGYIPLDYSLQLAVGLRNFMRSHEELDDDFDLIVEEVAAAQELGGICEDASNSAILEEEIGDAIIGLMDAGFIDQNLQDRNGDPVSIEVDELESASP